MEKKPFFVSGMTLNGCSNRLTAQRLAFLILGILIALFLLGQGPGETAEKGAAGPPSQTSQTPPLHQTLTDLELTNIWVNDQCHPRIQVTNRGKIVISPSTPCTINYYVDDKLFAPISGCTGKTLNPGESYTYEFGPAFVPGPGTHTLKAVADADNKLVESNKANNTKVVTVTCRPNLIPSKQEGKIK